MTSHDTRNAIEALLAGKPVPVEKTKVFGCSIKWSDKRDSVKKSLEAWAKEEVDLKLIDEKGIRSLVKNDGKNLRLINVWATWCGPCVAELPEFVTMNRMYRQPGLRVDYDLGRCPRGEGKGIGVPQEETGFREELPVRRERQVQADGCRGREVVWRRAAHDSDRAGRKGSV